MCKNADDNVGRLIKFLDESGLAKNTILVVTADHGEMLASHSRHDKMVPYREALEVPLIIRWPGHVPAGRRVETVYTAMDHFPTLCALAGLETPEGLDGKDLSRAALNQGDVDRGGVLIANYTSNWDYCDSGTNWPEWRGVRTCRYTFVKWLTGDEELYDHQQDPYQMNNLANDPEHGPLVRKLRA